MRARVGAATGCTQPGENASLRWHDPDQVRRSKLGVASSQPGSPDSRVRTNPTPQYCFHHSGGCVAQVTNVIDVTHTCAVLPRPSHTLLNDASARSGGVLPSPASDGGQATGSRMTTGMSRSVFRW